MDKISRLLKEIENAPIKFPFIPCPVNERDYLPLFITPEDKHAQYVAEQIIEEMDEVASV